tara:strand:- start:766 stop:1635 length:870 start_codon:yes stop_codon:yes gene_type:complete
MALRERQAKLSMTLKRILLERLENDELVVPVTQKTAQTFLPVLDDPKTELTKLSRLIKRDPIIIAHVLKMANSESHRSADKIELLSKAVSLVDIDDLKTQLTTAISQEIFVSHDPRINNTIQALMNHSLVVAHLAQSIAETSGYPYPELAYIAGSLSNLGRLVVTSYLLEFERSLPTREAMDWLEHDDCLNILRELHSPVGSAIVESWTLPADCTKTIDQSNGYDTAHRISPVNAVLFANALSQKEGLHVGEVDPEAVTSMIMIGKSILGLDDAMILGFLREIDEEILT